MRTKIQLWLRKQLGRLILWAAGDLLRTIARDNGYAAGRATALTEVSVLRDQIKALQMIDVRYQSRDKHYGKIILASSVGGRDFVQIIDVPPRMDLDQWKEMSFEIRRKFGAEIRHCDVPSHLRHLKDELIGVSKPLKRR